ncbi:unnamed protein product [Cuscuta epithymum]|nr:unnamed protein product [Cuscuta epithymum]
MRIKTAGKDSNGTFILGYNCLTHSNVIIQKIYHSWANPEAARSEIMKETSVLMKLRHENIARLLHVEMGDMSLGLVYEHDDHCFFMEKRKIPVRDPHKIKTHLHQILSALAHCHSLNVLHRDLRPNHLLMDSKGNVKLAGFGWAVLEADKSATIMSGTLPVDPLPRNAPEYRPPEYFLTLEEWSEASDVWSVGCIFAEMVTQEPLFVNADGSLGYPGAQAHKILQVVGPPEEDQLLPGYTEMCRYPLSRPQYRRMDFAKMFPGLEESGIDLLSQMLRVEPSRRIKAKDALGHEYFHDLDKPK